VGSWHRSRAEAEGLGEPLTRYRWQRAPSGRFPTGKRSGLARQVGRRWIESEELNDAAAMGFGRAVLVLLPFFDGRVSDANGQHFGQFAL
jgi:hypothetical protein